MKKYLFYIAALLIFLLIFRKAHSQTPASKPINTDSIQKVMFDSVNKLITEKFVANKMLIDSTVYRIKDKISANEFEKWASAYDFFIGELYSYWLEIERRKKKK